MTQTGNFHGVHLRGSLNTTSGAVTVRGTGGDAADNHGIFIDNGRIVSTGSLIAGGIVLDGIGVGAAGRGIRLSLPAAAITTDAGDVNLSGTSISGDAVELLDGNLTSVGQGPSAGTLTITGVASGSGHGAMISNSVQVVSDDGNILIDGESQTGIGVELNQGADIRSTGLAGISLSGYSNSNEGVRLHHPNSEVSTQSAGIFLFGESNSGPGLVLGANVTVAAGGSGDLTMSSGFGSPDAIRIGDGAGTASVSSGLGNVTVQAIQGRIALNNNASVTTSGGAVEVDAVLGDLTMSNGTSIAAGGDVTMTARGDITVTGVTSPGTAVVSASSGGRIFDGGSSTVDIAAPQVALRADAGIFAPDVSAATLAALNSVSGQLRVGNFDDPESVTIGTVDGLSGVTNANGQVSIFYQDLDVQQPIAATTSVSLSVDTLNLAAAVSGNNIFTAEPWAFASIGVGDAPGTLNLTGPELDQIQDGFSLMRFGGPGASTVTISDATLTDPALFEGDTIVVSGPLTGVDDAGFTFREAGLGVATTYLSADIVTHGNSLTFDDTVRVDGDITLDTTAGGLFPDGAGIDFLYDIDGSGNPVPYELTLIDGSSGAITFEGGIGNDVPLHRLQVETRDLEFAVGSSVIVHGPVELDANLIEFQNVSLFADGDVDLTADNGITVHATSLLSTGGGDFTANADADQDGTGTFDYLGGLSGNLISSASFESALSTGDPPDPIWSPFGDVAVAVDEPFGATDGTNALLFNYLTDQPSGEISQLIDTVPGETYTLSFDFGLVGDDSSGQEASLSVLIFDGDFDGFITDFVVFDSSADPAPNAFDHYEFSFVAESDRTTIVFSDDSFGDLTFADAALDNVFVAAPSGLINTSGGDFTVVADTINFGGEVIGAPDGHTANCRVRSIRDHELLGTAR